MNTLIETTTPSRSWARDMVAVQTMRVEDAAIVDRSPHAHGPASFAYVIQNKHKMWLLRTVDGRTLALSRKKREVLAAAKVISPFYYLSAGWQARNEGAKVVCV